MIGGDLNSDVIFCCHDSSRPISRAHPSCATVQPFNSCTSRPDVCQCLVVKFVWITCPKQAKYIIDTRCLRNKASLFSFEVIHTPMVRKMVGNRACGCVLCLGCPCSYSAGIKCRHCRSTVLTNYGPSPGGLPGAGEWVHKSRIFTVTWCCRCLIMDVRCLIKVMWRVSSPSLKFYVHYCWRFCYLWCNC